MLVVELKWDKGAEAAIADRSDTAESYVNAMTSDHAVYIPGGSLTGTGAGVYNLGDGWYYFYYGDYVDGVRTGKGVSFVRSYSDAYEYYEGMWSNDLPNGQGAVTTITTIDYDGYGVFVYIDIFSGNLVNGLWNGTVNIEQASTRDGLPYTEFHLSFVADNGVVTEDKTDEYLSHIKYLGYSREDVVSEDRIIYAFTGDTNGVEDGVETYYDDARVHYSCIPGAHLGVFGWDDRP